MGNQKRQQLETINKSINLAETDVVEGLLDHHKNTAADSTVSETEFVLLELLRLGNTQQSQLVQLKDDFKKLDKNGSGYLNRKEMWPDLHRDVEKRRKAKGGA